MRFPLSDHVPDPRVALALAHQNYWVVPLNGHRKHPDLIGRQTHGEILREGDHGLLLAHVEATQRSATGWALIPQPGDPTPLAVLDLDSYGLTLAAAWACLTDEPFPDNAAAVRSASGGWHFYFRLPDQRTADALPAAYDFGDGRKGEIRASRRALQLIVLPGSVCLGKQGALGQYTATQGDLANPAELSPLPPSLLTRLVGRDSSGSNAADAAAMPTEAGHLLRLLRFISEIPQGSRNQAAAWVGQILGRIGPGDRPSPETISNAWEVYKDLPAGEPWSFSEFEKAVRSGYKTGHRNAQKHAPRDKVPSEADAKAEVLGIFGGWPALAQIVDGGGKVLEYVLTAEERSLKLPSLDGIDIMATLTRLFPAVDRNAVTQSPAFILPGWQRAILYSLKSDMTTERAGNDPEGVFWEMLEALAVDSAADGKFLQVWTGAWKGLNASAFVVWPADDVAELVLLPDCERRLFARVGNAAEVTKLIKTHLRRKRLTGQRGGATILHIAVERLSEEAQAQVRKGYERWLAARSQVEETE